jgi:hypothetical protein
MLFVLPASAIFGYVMERSYPGFPGIFWISYLGLFLCMAVAFWAPVITNLVIHWLDSQSTMLPYPFVAVSVLGVFHLILLLVSYVQTRTRVNYSTIEIMHNFIMFAMCATMMGILTWAIMDG